MIQTPGKAQTPGTDVVTPKALASHGQASQKRSLKRTARMLGAGLVSAAMVGVFALPAYAATPSEGAVVNARAAYAQSLSTSSLAEVSVPAQIPSAEEQPLPVVVPAAGEATAASLKHRVDIPAGVGAEGLVAAALAQVGQSEPQDCTDLVQNSLAAIGMVTRRDQGGPDLGVSSFRNFGTLVTSGEYAPGDILGWPGAPHVAIYIGNGMAVHGGWNGDADTTVISGAFHYGTPEFVVRVG